MGLVESLVTPYILNGERLLLLGESKIEIEWGCLVGQKWVSRERRRCAGFPEGLSPWIGLPQQEGVGVWEMWSNFAIQFLNRLMYRPE